MSDSTTTAGVAEAPQPALDALISALSGDTGVAETPAPSAEVPATQEEAVEPAKEEAKEEVQPKREVSFEEKSALERARTALRRDGVKVATIDSLDQAELLKWGNARADAQAKVDDAFRQLGELRKEKETWQAKAAEAPKDSAPTEPAEQPFDLTSLSKTLLDSLADEGAVNAVVGTLKSLDERGSQKVKALEASLKETGEVNQRLANAILQLEMKESRRELGERFPQLTDKRNFDRVVEKMHKLAPSGAYESVTDLMAEASTILFAPELIAKSKSDSKSHDRKNGLPSTSGVVTAPKDLSPRDKAMQTLLELEKKHGL